MNQAKQAAARSWRSTLSSGGEEKEGQKAPSVSEDKGEPGRPQVPGRSQVPGRPQVSAEQRDQEKGNQDIQNVQLQALDAR